MNSGSAVDSFMEEAVTKINTRPESPLQLLSHLLQLNEKKSPVSSETKNVVTVKMDAKIYLKSPTKHSSANADEVTLVNSLIQELLESSDADDSVKAFVQIGESPRENRRRGETLRKRKLNPFVEPKGVFPISHNDIDIYQKKQAHRKRKSLSGKFQKNDFLHQRTQRVRSL